MQDQDCLNASREEMGKASINTKRQGIEDDFLDITALIRSIQRAEGSFDCFRRAKEYPKPAIKRRHNGQHTYHR